MSMTPEQRAVLAHVVVDPDAWYAHAVSFFGQALADKHLAAKVARWTPDYEAAQAKGGYQTRATRDIEEKAALDARIQAIEETR